MLEQFKGEDERAQKGIASLEQRLPFRITVLSRLLDRHLSGILARHNLALAAYRILTTIQSFGEISASELTRYTVIDRVLISRKIAELLKAGLIGSQEDPQAPGQKRLHLTEVGEEKLATLKPDIDKRLSGLSGQLDEDEHATLVRILDKLTAHVARDLQESSLAN